MRKQKKNSRLTQTLLETAEDMRRVGILDGAAHEKITLRHLGGNAEIVPKPMSGDEIRSLREPDPYKGKGIKYSDEVIRRKAGKAAGK